MVDVIPDHLGVLVLGCRLQFQPLVVGGVVGIAGVSGVERDSFGVSWSAPAFEVPLLRLARVVLVDWPVRGGAKGRPNGVRSARPLSGK